MKLPGPLFLSSAFLLASEAAVVPDVSSSAVMKTAVTESIPSASPAVPPGYVAQGSSAQSNSVPLASSHPAAGIYDVPSDAASLAPASSSSTLASSGANSGASLLPSGPAVPPREGPSTQPGPVNPTASSSPSQPSDSKTKDTGRATSLLSSIKTSSTNGPSSISTPCVSGTPSSKASSSKSAVPEPSTKLNTAQPSSLSQATTVNTALAVTQGHIDIKPSSISESSSVSSSSSASKPSSASKSSSVVSVPSGPKESSTMKASKSCSEPVTVARSDASTQSNMVTQIYGQSSATAAASASVASTSGSQATTGLTSSASSNLEALASATVPDLVSTASNQLNPRKSPSSALPSSGPSSLSSSVPPVSSAQPSGSAPATTVQPGPSSSKSLSSSALPSSLTATSSSASVTKTTPVVTGKPTTGRVLYRIVTKQGTSPDTFSELIKSLPDHGTGRQCTLHYAPVLVYFTDLTKEEAEDIAKKSFVDRVDLEGPTTTGDPDNNHFGVVKSPKVTVRAPNIQPRNDAVRCWRDRTHRLLGHYTRIHW